jgi:glycerophosphoryl diester phosphodiesterase family protein
MPSKQEKTSAVPTGTGGRWSPPSKLLPRGVLLAFGLVTLANWPLFDPLPTSSVSLSGGSSRDTAGCLRSPACRRAFVVAHRGYTSLWQLLSGRPENSRALVREAVDAGIPFVEVDIRLSKDGVPFVLHDITLERTTSCTGRVDEKEAGDLRDCVLRNGERLPRFEDIYELTRGKAILDLDLKADAVDEIADRLRANGSFDDAIFYVVRAPTIALAARAKSRTPDMLVMARVDRPEQAVDLERTFRSFGSPPPEVIHVGYPFLGPFRSVIGSHRFKVFADSWVLPVLSVPWLRISGVDLIESKDPIAVSRLF